MISICMIVKNEESYLEECLEHLSDFGYEILIADTGSTDCSRQIAQKYADQVFDYVWNQDFSAARNFIIEKANNEYILMIDSDEMVTSYDKVTLEKLVSENPQSVGRLLRRNEYNRGEEHYCHRERVSRLFPKSLYRYEGIIHEQITPLDGRVIKFYDIPVEMLHSGYEGDLNIRRRKTERNIRLLKQAIDRKGEDPYLYYQLGKSYYMQEDYQKSSEWFGKALYFDLDPHLEYVQDMVESYGYALINTKQYEVALQLWNVYEEFAVNADFIFLMGLIFMNNAMFDAAIEEFLKATNTRAYKMDGVTSYRAYYNIGVIYECLGDLNKAKEYYLRCDGYHLARIRLNCLV